MTGRRNYLFFGSDNGGESAAIIYSLLVTCKLNGVEPEDWLREVIVKINNWCCPVTSLLQNNPSATNCSGRLRISGLFMKLLLLALMRHSRAPTLSVTWPYFIFR
ncbi:hypothetical protein GFU58_16645 [Escherichia coli]|nr:hypothetical protein [Escherichia coli]HAG9232210.1 hypothetical protein [Escherichia coli]HAH0305694.1 hypothetical protein [Escherichia coli]HAH2604100.1 hypothetical protein [Escherichia coli]HAH3265986.1 hypothetical protein [Escherichia coli]